MEKKFTIKEIRNYLLSQYNIEDAISFLSAKSIEDSNSVSTEREYNQNFDMFDEVMTLDRFDEKIKTGAINSTLGWGYWVKDGFASADEVFDTPPLDATHVIWHAV
jgi:hypothetical protein